MVECGNVWLMFESSPLLRFRLFLVFHFLHTTQGSSRLVGLKVHHKWAGAHELAEVNKNSES